MIGTRCKHSNAFSRGVLISRVLLGNLQTNSLVCESKVHKVIKSIKSGANAFYFLNFKDF